MIKRFTLVCLALLFAFSAQGFAQNEISPAKRGVELAIEDSEDAAMTWIDEQLKAFI